MSRPFRDGSRLEQLYGEHYANVVWEFRRYATPEEAEDLAQETFLKVGVALGCKDVADPAAYLWTAVRNRVRNWLRDRREDVSLEEQAEGGYEPVHPQSAEAGMCAETRKDALLDAIAVLPRSQREAYSLVDLRGFTEGEAAEVLGISRSTVSTHRSRALKALKSGYLLADTC
jgi:RNA polymerase sigma factor (sigma-70 family)